MVETEDIITYVFLYDNKKLTESVISVLNKIKDIEIISKISIDSTDPWLQHNSKEVIIKPEDLPVFAFARTGQKTIIYSGDLEHADKIIGIINNLWKT